MRLFHYYSLELRKQLIVLILIIFIPVLVILLFTAYRQHQHTLRNIEDNANRVIRLFIEEQLNIVNQTRQLLNVISHVPAVRGLDLAPCNAFLKDIHRENPQYSTIVAANPQGTIDCCAIPLKQSIDVKDRRWFQRVTKSKEFIIDNFLISRSAHKASLPFAFPVLDEENKLIAVVGAAYDLENYRTIFSRISLPDDSVIFVIDRQNVLLYQSISGDEYIGKTLSQCRGFDIPPSRKGSLAVKDSDGVKRIYWFERLFVGEESNQVSIVIGVPEQAIYSEARLMLATNLSLLTVLASLCFAMAWLFGKKYILDPVNLLVKKTRHVQKGDLSPSNAMGLLPGEFSILGRAFDEMLSNLSQREAERDKALDALKNEIVQHKETEAALREREERLRILFEQAADAVYVSKPDGCLIKVNQQACRSTGYTEDELLGLNVIAVDVRIASPEAFHELAQNLSHGHPVTIESAHRRKDGSTFPVEITIAPLQTPDGPHILGIARDITERRKAEEEKDKMETQLRQAQKLEAIGTLAGGIAHDFNNILAPIIGYTEMVIGDLPESAPMRADLEQVLHAAQRARDLVRQILAVSRQGQSRERAPADISSIVKEVLKLLRASLPSSIEIRESIERGVTPADATQIHQVLVNLCTNASHAMEEKGVLTVSLSSVELSELDLTKLSIVGLKPGAYLKLSVSDTGCGMDAGTLQRIFDPYFTTKEVGKGSGLGLAVVHGIVKRHEGAVSVRSEPGKGSAFDVFLPRIDTEPETATSMTSNLPGGTEQVLLVDDEQVLADLGAVMLERLGYSVTAKTSAPDALELFISQPHAFDLVITDYTMPHLTGADLAVEILKVRPSTPIILCTGYSERVTEAKAKELGIKGFAMKPLDKKQLAELIRSVLDEKNR